MMHGFIPPHRYFPYLTWTDIDSMPDKENVVIIHPPLLYPVSTTENLTNIGLSPARLPSRQQPY